MKKIVFNIFFFFAFSNFLYSQSDYNNYFKGVAAFENSDFETAIEFFNISVTEEGADFNDYIYRGKSYYKLKQYDKAITDFKTAENLKISCGNYLISECYALLGNSDSAIYFLMENLNSKSKVLKSEILTNDAFNELKLTYKWTDFLKEDLFTKQDLILNDANYLLKNEKYIDALVKINEILIKNKKKHSALALKGEIFMAMQEYKSASECFLKASELNYNPEYLEKLAFCYFKSEKFKKATEIYSNLIENENPKDIKNYYHRALSYSKLNNYELALTDILKYLNYYNSDIEANYKCAEIYYNSGNYLESIKILNKLIEIEPSNAEYYSLRGKSYLYSNSYNLSINDLTYALDLNPNLTDVYMFRAEAKLKSDDVTGACNDWNKSIENGDYRANNYIIKYCDN